jgi:hypothetical protein
MRLATSDETERGDGVPNLAHVRCFLVEFINEAAAPARAADAEAPT